MCHYAWFEGLFSRGLFYTTVILLVLHGMAVFAEPCTLYKPKDIANARENLKRYEWARRIVEGWKRSADYAMQQDRDFFVDLIPELTPGTHYGQNCPACVGDKSMQGEYGFYSWSITAPDQLKCNRCGTVFPNDEYPETGVVECPRMGQTFTYYQPPAERALGPEATPEQRREHALRGLSQRQQMTSLSSLIRLRKAQWAWGQVLLLAKLYAVTEEVAYAERAAWILDRFAQVFPNYLYHSYDGSIADWPPAEVAANMGEHGGGGRFPPDVIRHAYGLNQYEDYSQLHNGFWGAGRLSPHGKGSDSGPLLNMTIAYDLIREARYPDGKPVVTPEMDKRIVADLIAAGCTDMEHWDSVSNKGVATFSLSAAVGLLLKQPERVHRALDGFHETLDSRYHFDGFYTESPAYAAHNFSNMRELPDLLYGYSDPPDYQPEEGGRIEACNPFAEGRFHLAMQSMVRMLAPGRRLPVIGDTVYNSGLSAIYAEVLAARSGGRYAGLLESVQDASLSDRGSEYSLWYRAPDLQAEKEGGLPLRSEWFPGWHVAVLRGGRDTNDTALYLNGNENRWTTGTGHRHLDILSMSYYALGEELASDRGYFSGSGQLTRDGRSGQRWTRDTLSHNLVVVDEKSQAARDCGSNLELFGVAPGLEVVQACGVEAYPQCDQYRRTCALIKTPGQQHYVVDFFRVTGGGCHQYSFHCNGSLVRHTPADTALQPVELAATWSTWLTNPQALEPEVPHTFTWQSGNVSLDLRLLNTHDSVQRVIITDAPGWRRASGSDLDKPPIQQILAENRASGPEAALATQYAAVMVPYTTPDSPVIAARLLANDPDTGTLAVEVTLQDRTDYIISTLDQEPRQYGPVAMTGQFGFVSVNGHGEAVQAYLLNGSSLEYGKMRLDLASPNTTVKVRATADRTFELAEPLPVTLAAGGSYLLVGETPRTGFEIEATTADSITVRDYPAIACDELTILHSTWLEFKP